MPQFRRLFAFVFDGAVHSTCNGLTLFSAANIAPVALAWVALASTALPSSVVHAQGRGAYVTPLHVPASRFEFVASGDAGPLAKPLAVHNGGATPLTEVRLTRLVYADSARNTKWLVALPRQSAVAPDELATVGTLCINADGLPAGTYRATAAVAAREVREPVPITVTLVVTDAGARARAGAARCTAPGTK